MTVGLRPVGDGGPLQQRKAFHGARHTPARRHGRIQRPLPLIRDQRCEESVRGWIVVVRFKEAKVERRGSCPSAVVP